MPEVFLASAALKANNYDGLNTISEAKRHGFDGVQLYIDNRYHSNQYLIEIAKKLKSTRLGLVVYLPNTPSQTDLDVADYLARVFPDSKTLIHYFPATELPSINNTVIGWENSMTGQQDTSHIEEVFGRSRRDETFFVFDIGRPLYAPDNDPDLQSSVINFVRHMISQLDQGNDLIHLADKLTWPGKFRDVMCTLGQGICGVFLDDLRDFSGIIVLEHEDLQMAVDSLPVLR